ncbi:MAG TPA: DUF4956 domain-containing protein [Gaiellaceae bacterium]|jgi:hypothetical protein|nr:DUF4956 domain-containing protein [Gaiellaceae bacterium]
MTPPRDSIPLDEFIPALGVDLVAIFLLAYVIYFRRHERRDLLTAYVCFNVGLFAVVTAMAAGGEVVSIGLGLGLFGALSIIRLRSEEISYIEVAYFFAALALGIVNGIHAGSTAFTVLLNGVVIGAMFAMDRLEPHRGVRRLTLVLDEVRTEDTALRAELERRLGFEVVAATIMSVDYVREVMTVEARYLPRRTRPGDPADGGELMRVRS